VWYDDRLHSHGGAWVAAIERELQSRDCFLLLLTPDAWSSEWVQREYQLALITGRFIVPLKLKETRVSGFLLTLQWISVEGVTPADAIRQVAQLLQNVKFSPVAPAAAALPKPAAATVPKPAAATVPEPDSSALPGSPAPSPNINLRVRPQLFIWSIAATQPPRIETISNSTCTIGRDPDNDIALEDPAISRHHVVLEGSTVTFAREQWTIRARDGSRAMYINGHACSEARLRPMDQIVLGTTVMRFELTGALQVQTLVQESKKFPVILVDSPVCHFVALLHEPSISFGRDAECGLVIPSPVVGRVQGHLRQLPDGGYALSTANATNPVIFEGQPVAERNLSAGDTFTIGEQFPDYTVMLRYLTSAL
jgi:pSer/pThr/pTyr-binding forkhead associated (FHA) protein